MKKLVILGFGGYGKTIEDVVLSGKLFDEVIFLDDNATDEKVKGVSIEGAKYPLKNATLTRKHQFAVSNEIVKNCALINVKKGGIYIIESRDI